MPFTTDSPLVPPRSRGSASTPPPPAEGRTNLITSRPSRPAAKLLAALAVFIVSITTAPTHVQANGVRPDPASPEVQIPAPLNSADCSDGTWVDDPEDNLGLVADCVGMVAVRNHFMSNPANAEIDWDTPWRGTITQKGRVEYLDLSDNQLTGAIPTELSKLTNLVTLDLNGNQLTGPIPTELSKLTNLNGLNLSYNQLTGAIPTELSKLTYLHYLNLSGNQLSGTIPTEITNLRHLNLSYNQLTGAIPTELSKLTYLHYLNLSGNQLSGTIPAELSRLTNLRSLSLSHTGTIPAELVNLTNLESLFLSGNQLSGVIPAELSKLTNLRSLSLTNSQLTGTIPTELSKLTNLQTLNLSGNQLTGTIPTELSKLTNLENLYLSGNQLTGDIPAEQGKTNLHELHLSDNQLTGTIPTELSKLTYLHYLNLSGNQLTGNIPTELGELTNLLNLNLSDNQLTGVIPAELSKLTKLVMLKIDGNRLSGEIPASLQVYQWFNFCPNRLTGTLPSQLRSVSDSFEGNPDDIGPFCNFQGPFSDDEGSVHEDSIKQISQWDITTGCKYRRFCPTKTVTRAQMAAFLYRTADHLYGTPAQSDEAQLSDVDYYAWYRTNALWAVNNGVIRAPGGRFDPGGAVTRADMAEMLVAAFNHLTAPAQAQGLFSDTTSSSDAVIRAMKGIHAAGVTTECATEPLRYCPDRTVTRAQMASFLTRAVQTAAPNP